MYRDVLHEINFGPISAALRLLPPKMDSLRARAQMLKIGLQESRFTARDQIEYGRQILGPALGAWQFERMGGVKGVLLHPLTRRHARQLCMVRDVPATNDAVWRALKTDDVLAAGFARLNCWWYHGALPDVHDEQESWNQYIECWRPGKPHRETWGKFHKAVVDYLLDPC